MHNGRHVLQCCEWKIRLLNIVSIYACMYVHLCLCKTYNEKNIFDCLVFSVVFCICASACIFMSFALCGSDLSLCAEILTKTKWKHYLWECLRASQSRTCEHEQWPSKCWTSITCIDMYRLCDIELMHMHEHDHWVAHTSMTCRLRDIGLMHMHAVVKKGRYVRCLLHAHAAPGLHIHLQDINTISYMS